MFLVKPQHSSKNFIIKGLITAIFLSAFIYLSHFGINFKIIDSILGLIGFYLLLTIPRKSVFYTGFFVGLFWFYWISISLKYYDLLYLIPIILFMISIFYGIVFLLFSIYDKPIARLLLIFAFTFISPLGFNWLKFELIFINSYFGTSKEAFGLILISIFIFITLKKFKILAIIPLCFALSFEKGLYIDKPNASIYMTQMNIKQNLKWEKEYVNILLNKNFKEIQKAINLEYDLIILPETAFPKALNMEIKILEKLKLLSKEIDIVTGALYFEDNQIYNATYHFDNTKLKIAKKVVLVPFGEEIPLPKYFVNLINDFFYNGAKDYAKASKPTNFEIFKDKFRNAICYEATTDKIFQNLNEAKYMIATSNNAWFTPSIEPTLQNLLLKYYAKKYNITIYHIVNGSKNQIFNP